MTAKEYLNQLREVKRQQRIIQEEIDELTIRPGTAPDGGWRETSPAPIAVAAWRMLYCAR